MHAYIKISATSTTATFTYLIWLEPGSRKRRISRCSTADTAVANKIHGAGPVGMPAHVAALALAIECLCWGSVVVCNRLGVGQPDSNVAAALNGENRAVDVALMGSTVAEACACHTGSSVQSTQRHHTGKVKVQVGLQERFCKKEN